jgi:UDP-N-acetyl-D-galactosamine dehydrogenase
MVTYLLLLQKRKIMRKKICIIGLGYVGLPLAHAFAEKYAVVGLDINKERIDELNNGSDRTLELTDQQIKESIANGIIFTSDWEDAKTCNIYIVTVPTPIDNENEPDLTPLIKSSQAVGKVLKKSDIVIYESTVYPGVTEEICVPALEKFSGLTFNKDFFCGYSPERINPGDKEHTVTKILKITAGSTPEVAKMVDELYKSIITAGTHLAPTIKVAEAAKVIENTQRDVNIALMNELAIIFDMMDIDTSSVLEAAGTKWNFIKLSPGLVGGHCIGVDPYYLTHKAQALGYTPNLILGARQINNSIAKLIAAKAVKYMVKNDTKLNGANVLVLGITFKENCPDMRNTKVVDIISELKEFECHVDVYDYWVDKSDRVSKNINFIDTLPYDSNKYAAIIIAVGHDRFKEITKDQFAGLSQGKPITIDVKGIIKNPTWRL